MRGVDTTRLDASWAEHWRTLERGLERALSVARAAGGACDGLVLHAGSAAFYPADDQEVPFRPHPHFARFAPLPGPEHLLRLRPGERARLVRVVPDDYWHGPAPLPEHPFANEVELVEVGSAAAAGVALGPVDGCAFVGPRPERAAALGLPAGAVAPPALLAALDWERGTKTPYEVDRIRDAVAVAARGHAAVRSGLAERRSEFALHGDYLAAAGLLECESPYPNIIAWDEGASILHYGARRRTPPAPGRALLIDAGGSALGYASDVTRSYAAGDAPEPFRALIERIDTLQRGLVEAVGPGVDFVELHRRAVMALLEALREVGVVRCGVDEAFALGVGHAFMPHGLGHHLGLQVHDVGGRLASPDGGLREPPEDLAYLRTTRVLAPGHVVTIEPGCYFIPSLLEPLRASAGERLDWALVDALRPCGGIRIEDDVLVTDDGREDLSRSHVPAGGSFG